MIRTGETVVVPIGFTLIRCGISEPVTKTASLPSCVLFSEVWLAGLPASAVPASTPVAMSPATHRNIGVLMSNLTTARSSRKPGEREGSIPAFRRPFRACTLQNGIPEVLGASLEALVTSHLRCFQFPFSRAGEIRNRPVILSKATPQTNLYRLSLLWRWRGPPLFRRSRSDSRDR